MIRGIWQHAECRMLDRIGEFIAAACIMALPYILAFIGLALGYH